MRREGFANWPALDREVADTDPTHPLRDFYDLAGLPLPRMESIPGVNVPEPSHTLLVHENDMTPTLERHHGSRIHLRVLRSRRQGRFYYREVVLLLDGTEQPVEFGANKVDLQLYPPAAQDLILKEYVPLGSILAQFRIAHTCHPSAYLRIEPDELISRELQLSKPVPLYGRRNTLKNPQGEALSEIVEILPHS